MANGHGNDLYDRPTGELLRELSQQTTDLVRQEIELAKAELGEKGKRAGIGVGMFGGAGLFGVARVRGADRGDHRGARPRDAVVARRR